MFCCFSLNVKQFVCNKTTKNICLFFLTADVITVNVAALVLLPSFPPVLQFIYIRVSSVSIIYPLQCWHLDHKNRYKYFYYQHLQEQTQHYFCIGAVVRLPELVLVLRSVLLTTLANCHTSHHITLHLYPNGTRSSALKETCCILKNVYQNTNVNTVFTNLNIKSRGRVRTLNGHVTMNVHVTVHFNLYINFAQLLNLQNIIHFLLITAEWI